MPNPYFSFKRFTVYHDRCAMKVGTDGVLIGTWTDFEDAERVLDVGAGSGLISLILAQRNSALLIDPIEIDKDATIQCNENIINSPFTNISSCRNITFQEFAEKCTDKYDLIASNPPFFSRSLKSPDSQRSTARHTDSLLIEDFISLSGRLLSKKGRISFIFPYQQKDYLIDLANKNELYLSRMTDVIPTPTSNPKRVLVELSKLKNECRSSQLIIESERHVYSDDFVEMIKDFYLKY